MPALHLTEVATVFVPVADQDAARRFYVETLGFEVRVDFPYGAEAARWVEVMPPGATNALALVGAAEGTSPGGDVTRCALSSSDVEADHAALKAAGVDVDDQIAGQGSSRTGLVDPQATIADPVPAQFAFRDLDGNSFLVVQSA